MKFRYILFFGSFFSFFLVVGCDSSKESDSLEETSILSKKSPSNLGQVQAALTLPAGNECFLFSALDENNIPLFEIDIEQARVRNYQYSFLYHLPLGHYHLIGELQCVDQNQNPITHQSLASDFTVVDYETTTADFRFFTPVDSDLNQVDLLFCAELAQLMLTPAPQACSGERMYSEYQVDWFLDLCGDVYLSMQLGDQTGRSDLFAYPTDLISIELNAPQTPGVYELITRLHGLNDSVDTGIDIDFTEIEVVECEAQPPTRGEVCDQVETRSWYIEFPATQECSWNENDNLPRRNGYQQARTTQNVRIELNPHEYACDLRSEFSKDEGGVSTQLHYDDSILFTINQRLLFASTRRVTHFLSQDNDGYYIYDWSELRGQSLHDSSPYVLGDESESILPAHDVAGDFYLAIEQEEINTLMNSIFTEQALSFDLTVTGDNDNGDCEHSGFGFWVEVDVGVAH